MHRKINILFVIQSMMCGGAEMFTIRLAEKLNKSYFNPMICSLSDKGPLKKLLKGKGISFFSVDKRTGKDIGLPFRLRKLIKELDVDIIHTHNQGPLVYTYMATRFYPRPLFIHTEHCRLDKEQAYSKTLVYCNRLFLRAVDIFISIADHITEYFKRSFKIVDGKILTIPNGVDVVKFSKGGRRAELRKELGIDENTALLGNISGLRSVKNQGIIIKALKNITIELPNVKLLIAGAGELSDELNNLIKTLHLENRAFLLGYRSDLIELLSSFDIFILPSLSEGFPLVLLEASAVGLPVVCTDIPGNREIVQNCQNGLLVRPGNQNDLEKAIIKLLSDKGLREKMGRRGKILVGKYYDLNETVLKYEKSYINYFLKKHKLKSY